MADPVPAGPPTLPSIPGPRRGPRARGMLALAAIGAAALVVGGLVAAAWLRAPSGGPATGSTGPAGVTQGGAARVPAGSASVPGSPRIGIVDDEGALWTVDPSGGSRVSYAVPGVVFGFPTWSPDGSQIAAVGQGAADIGIYVFPAAGAGGVAGQPSVVYRSADESPFYLYWTPDGARVSFLTNEPDGLALRVAAVAGTAPAGTASILRRGAPLYFQWEDGARALLHVGSGSGAFTGELGIDGGSLGSPIGATGVFRPAVTSHDGRFVAYATASGATGDIVVAERTTARASRLYVAGPAALLFDPVADSLATIGAVDAASTPLGFPIGPLRLIDASTGAVRILLDGPVVGCFWSPDGRTIAALRLTAAPGGSSAKAGNVVLAADSSPAPSPPARGGHPVDLAFIDVATGAIRGQQVVRLDDLFVNQLLPYFDQYALSHRLWSPDSAALLLPVVDATGRDAVVSIPADGSAPRRIADGAMAFWSP